MIRLKLLLLAVLSVLAPVAGAQEGVIDPGFPAWTYYGEIFEHYAILVVALLGVAGSLLAVKKLEGDARRAFNLLALGWGVIALSQVLVNVHHYGYKYLFPWTALIHHGTLLAGLVVLLYALNELSKALVKEPEEK
ncbi:MAG TPA: hypothetical protein VJI67_03465 [archaeon]|nr:hypothetical protein [archaeon]HLD81079.1 hypothetical protein [archaeon]